MRPLDKIIKTNGHIYTQLKRNDKAAVYEQRTKDGQLAGHEVILIKKLPAETVFDKELPERESYPKTAEFGSLGWSTGMDPKRAFAKFNSIA